MRNNSRKFVEYFQSFIEGHRYVLFNKIESIERHRYVLFNKSVKYNSEFN